MFVLKFWTACVFLSELQMSKHSILNRTRATWNNISTCLLGNFTRLRSFIFWMHWQQWSLPKCDLWTTGISRGFENMPATCDVVLGTTYWLGTGPSQCETWKLGYTLPVADMPNFGGKVGAISSFSVCFCSPFMTYPCLSKSMKDFLTNWSRFPSTQTHLHQGLSI